MWTDRLPLCRSLLFLPASNPRAISKARELAADMVILDLEDAVRAEDKAAAREGAIAALREGFGDRIVAIRINAVGTPHHGEDMIAARRARPDLVILPKVERSRDVLDTGAVAERPILSMIETPRGVLAAADIALESVGLMAGVNDLAAELHLPAASARAGLTLSLQMIVLAARAAGVPAFDGVYNALSGDEDLAAEAREARSFGFSGKSVIHPSQIDVVNRAFMPGDEELEAAASLVAAAKGGAERHRGRMVEAMHVEQARLLLRRAGRHEGG